MTSRMFDAMILSSSLFVSIIFVWITGDVLLKGLVHLSWDFLISAPENSGRSGGIGPILVSTAALLFIALSVAIPLGLGTAIWLSEFAKDNERFATITSLTLDVLAGIPSIVYGLFGNAFFCVFLGLGFSILSGGLTLAFMILPVFIRTCEAGLSAVNTHWRQGGHALGITRISTVWHILLPAASPAIIAGLILSIGRATAETAALIFTSGYVDRMPGSVMDSGRALSVHIYDLSMNVTGGDQAAYTSALTLICIIIVLNISAQIIMNRWLHRRTVK